MSNPLVTLKKPKKPPLYLPEMFHHHHSIISPAPSSIDMNKSLNSSTSTVHNEHQNQSQTNFNPNYGFTNNGRFSSMSNKHSTINGKNGVSPRSTVASTSR